MPRPEPGASGGSSTEEYRTSHYIILSNVLPLFTKNNFHKCHD